MADRSPHHPEPPPGRPGASAPDPPPSQATSEPPRSLIAELTVLDGLYGFVRRIDQSPCQGCDGCGARCVSGFQISLIEFRRIQDFLATTEGAVARSVESFPKVQPYPGDHTAGATYVACRFRNTERDNCAIYPVRPLICRLFGHVEWLPCPIERVERTDPGGVEAIGRYAGLRLRTYEEWLDDDGI